MLAVVAYFAIRYGLPAFVESNPLLRPYGKGAPQYANYAAVGFAALSLMSAVRGWCVRRQFDAQESLDSLRELHWKRFEDLVGEFYRRKGYRVTETLGGGADGGIDLKLTKDGDITFVQCKRWKGKKVGLPTVRELLGAMTAERAQHGVLVTTSNFTTEAESFTRDHSIELIDGDGLLEMIIPLQHSTKDIDSEADFEASIDIPTANDRCPECGNHMVLRTARKGSNSGAQFWGCSKFPSCRGTRAA